MKKRKGKEGFTLAELLIVLAIMIVLGAVLAGAYSRYIRKAQETKCLYNLKILMQEANLALAASGGEAPLDNLIQVVKGHSGTVDVTRSKLLGLDTETYDYIYFRNQQFFLIQCPAHSDRVYDISLIADAVVNLERDSRYEELFSYLDEGETIDSEEKGAGHSLTAGDAVYESYGKAFCAALKVEEIDLEERSFCLIKSGEDYTLYVADRKIAKDDLNKEVEVVRYVIKKKNSFLESGIVQTEEKEGYFVLEPESFQLKNMEL